MHDIKQLHQQAQVALNHGDFATAQRLLITILNQQPSFHDGYFLLGVIEAELGQYTKAVSLIQKAISLHSSAEYYAHLAKCLAMQGLSNETFAAIQQAEKFDIKQALTIDTLGVALSRIGDHQKAIGYFERAISIKSKASFYYNLGSSQTFSGQFDNARQSYEKAIELEPLFYQAHSSLSHLGGISIDNNHIARLKSVFMKLSHPDAQLHISHALARELEIVGQYQECFEYLEKAKQKKRAKLHYNFEQDRVLFNDLKTLFSQTEIQNKTNLNSSQSQPIFVVGMPRSGTTLIERVLTNNSIVKSAGELQEFGLALKQLTHTAGRYILDPDTIKAAANIDFAQLGRTYIDSLNAVVAPEQRFVDKMPLNVLYSGFIAKSLPKSKTVCVIRNPMDTVWGNYKQMFSLNDPYYNYSYDQSSIAQFYCEFVQLAEFWQSIFPNQFKIVYYDEFVKQPEIIGKQVVEFCDLEFELDMLDITQNKSAVATASSVQVRSKINTKSLGQWRRFEPYLKAAKSVFDKNSIKVF